jgi:hypothetical protein
MTEQRADDTTEREKKEQERDRREQRHGLWEAVNKALNALMVGHAAGLVTCLTLIKDYNSTPQLRGLGTFIALFGFGLVCAVSSALVWIVARANYIVLPTGKRLNIPSGKLDWTTAALALVSTVLMVFTILIAVCKFATL